MFGKRIRLFKILGFEIRIDLSWFVILVLVVWSLAGGVFPAELPGRAAGTYIFMGLAAALAFFASIVVHELCHSLVARRYGLPMEGITLFIFGGVSEMTDEPPNPKTEFLMAIAGPLSSFAIGFIAVALAAMADAPSGATAVFVTLRWIGIINIVLGAMNLVPGYPLDGGRVLRSVLWHFKGNLRWATRAASYAGEGFGILLIGSGAVGILMGGGVGGMWNILIGWFLVTAARQGYRQVLVRQMLQGEPVQRIMTADAVTVPPSISLQELVENYVYRYHFKMFPVVEDGQLAGCISTRDVREVPRADWATRTVGEVIHVCQDGAVISADADAMAALTKMARAGASRLMVVDGRRLVGIVALKDLMAFLARKLELEGEDPGAAGL